MAPRSPVPAARRWIAGLAVGALAIAGATGCSSDESDVDTQGATDQAVEQLEGFGLTTEEATCVVDELGAATVVEAADLTALAESQAYRDAAEACTGAG